MSKHYNSTLNFKYILLSTLLFTLPCSQVSFADNAKIFKNIKTSPFPVSTPAFPKQAVALKNGVHVWPKVIYSTVRGYRPLSMDIYTSTFKQSKPLVIFIHGGGWFAGSSDNLASFTYLPDVMSELVTRGFTVASVNYRLSSEAPFPAALQDVRTAIRWLKKNAAHYNIDKEQVYLWGSSAGGQISTMAAVSCDNKKLDATPEEVFSESPCVQGNVSWYGIFDFNKFLKRPVTKAKTSSRPSPAKTYLGCLEKRCEDVAKMASPISHIDSSDPQMLLIHGDKDNTVPVSQSVGMHKALEKAGVTSHLLLIPGMDHSFMGATPKETRGATLKALKATFDFFDQLSNDSSP